MAVRFARRCWAERRATTYRRQTARSIASGAWWRSTDLWQEDLSEEKVKLCLKSLALAAQRRRAESCA